MESCQNILPTHINRQLKKAVMNKHDNEGTPGTKGSGQQDLPDMPNEMPDFHEKKHTSRESAVAEDEIVLSDRETSVAAREEAAYLREDAANLREGAALLREEAARLREVAAGIREGEAHVRDSATVRERETRLGETQVASGRIKVLQEANARLVVATVEARKLVEQVENAKTQLDHLAHHDALSHRRKMRQSARKRYWVR